MTRDMIVERWKEIEDKLVGLAEAVPADVYEFRPVPAARSFADQLRHVAFWNASARDTLRGETADGEANELPRDAYPHKAAVVGVLRATFADVRAEAANGDANVGARALGTLVSFLEHAGEHYGQLVVYARLCGVVPPASRADATEEA